LTGVFVYMVVVKMLLGKAYLALQPAQGTVRMQLKAPAAPFLLPPQRLPYCLTPPTTPPHHPAEHSRNSSGGGAGQHPCLYLVCALTPVRGAGAGFVTSRVGSVAPTPFFNIVLGSTLS